MANILMLYGTSEGHTLRVAARLSTVLLKAGHDVTSQEIRALDADDAVAAFDAVIVASSIHAGQPNRRIAAFVKAHREALHARPSAYVQVSLSTADPRPEKQAEAQLYADRFFEATRWTPDHVAFVGGALPYTRYGFVKRLFMKRIAGEPFDATDTGRDYEFTDWEAVDAFARRFAAELTAVPAAPGKQPQA